MQRMLTLEEAAQAQRDQKRSQGSHTALDRDEEDDDINEGGREANDG